MVPGIGKFAGTISSAMGNVKGSARELAGKAAEKSKEAITYAGEHKLPLAIASGVGLVAGAEAENKLDIIA